MLPFEVGNLLFVHEGIPIKRLRLRLRRGNKFSAQSDEHGEGRVGKELRKKL